MRSLSPETYQALHDFCEREEWAPIFGYMEPDAVAWLAYRLEQVADDDTVFPRGKWATIQRLQDLVRAAALAAAKPSQEQT